MPAVRQELGALTRLALPLIAGFLGNQLMGFVDTAMVGRLGAAAIGGVGIATGIYATLSLVVMGIVLGMDPLTSQAVGAGEHARARRILWQGLRVALWASVPMTGLILVAPALILPAVGVDREVARLAQEHLWGRAWNAIPFGAFAAMRCYLQAVGLTRPIVVCTVVANGINFLGDAVLIYGDEALGWVGLPGIGLPAWGVFGAGLASTLAAIASLSVLVVAVRSVPAPPDPARRRRDMALVRRILALGGPVGMQMLVEVSAFATASVLSGKIGQIAAAGNQIALSLASATFMVPLGISAATAVRVGQGVGMGDRRRARLSGACGFALSLCFMAVAALAFDLVPGPLARVLTDKDAVVTAAVPLVQIAGLFQLCDGIQVVGAGALRGVGDTRTPLIANVVGHFLVGLPVAVGLAFGRGMGGPGLWWGLSLGLTIVAVWLSARFWRVTARDIARA